MPTQTLNLDDYVGYDLAVWASTPAIVWTAERPQEFGIHVHVQNAESRIVDDTFGEVIYQGAPLERSKLVADMMARTVV